MMMTVSNYYQLKAGDLWGPALTCTITAFYLDYLALLKFNCIKKKVSMFSLHNIF